MEAVPFRRSHSFSWKPFLSVEVIGFREKLPFSEEFCLVQAALFSKANIFFSGSLFYKPFF